MSPHKDIKFPPLTPSQKQRLTTDHSAQKCTLPTSKESQEEESVKAVFAQPSSARKLSWTGSSYIYASPGRKPQLLMQLESYVKKRLHMINPHEPEYQELKLQVYRKVFGCFIKEFKTYQPLLSAIKKEYENTLAYQQNQIRELKPLRSHLRLVTEECDRKILAHWEEEHTEIGALKREKQELQRNIDAMREKEKAMQAVVDHLQSELSNQYVKYRYECEARKLLIWQLNEQTRGSAKEEHSAYENAEEKDPVELQLSLKVCQEDLTKVQEELNRMKAEYWDVVPQLKCDTLEQTHRQTLLQLKTLQGDFNCLKREYDTLLELHKRGKVHAEIHDSTTLQMDECVSQGQSQIRYSQLKEPINSDTVSLRAAHLLSRSLGQP
uniref:translin-associated factor X-interacting protein 1 isoform X2 n=1 Tax=Monopterus albus TaxID=43700 RepID=UPI0009B2EB63|nr:translin-associated factor X-interacting protein 1 isoform X2 [Monopterus albus]